MLRLVLLCLALQYAAALYDCPAFGGLTNPDCPVSATIGRQRTCFAMVTSSYGSAYTFGSGDKRCKEEFGADAHLANIYGKSNFEEVRCYMIEQTDVMGSRDPKVLLGMSYSPDTAVTKLYDGSVQRNSYWGRSIPLRYGTRMVMRANEELSRSKLLNFGGEEERYERILCEYPTTK